MTAEEGIEKQALRRSLLGYVIFGSTGVTFSIIAGSDAILLDGVYSAVCAVVAIAALHVSRLVVRPDDASHPFGYAKYEPLLNSLKGILILLVCLISAGGSIEAIVRGGREPIFGWGIVYAVISAAGCFFMAALQHKSAVATGSALLAVEARSWIFDGAISSGVGLVFLVAIVLSNSPASGIVPYVDPVMTLLLVLVLLPVPIGTIGGSVRELLFQSPEQKVHEKLDALCREELQPLGFSNLRLRCLRVGRTIYVMASYLLAEDENDPTVAALDSVRTAIGDRIRRERIAPIVYVDIVVTRQSALV